MNYPYLLFDADNTLFNFDRANQEAFHAVCRQFDIPDSDETFALYERCNNEMWAAFDRGEWWCSASVISCRPWGLTGTPRAATPCISIP